MGHQVVGCQSSSAGPGINETGLRTAGKLSSTCHTGGNNKYSRHCVLVETNSSVQDLYSYMILNNLAPPSHINDTDMNVNHHRAHP